MTLIPEAVSWNKTRHADAATREIQAAMDITVDGLWGRQTVRAVMFWQLARGLEPDGKVGPKTQAAIVAGEPRNEEAWLSLDDDEIDRIIAATIEVESAGAKNPYAASNRDAEWNGWFDKPKRDAERNKLKPSERAKQPNHKPHKASKYGPTPSHIGLSHGPIQTTQDGGSLGLVLQHWYDDEPNVFAATFGPTHGQMLRVVTAEGTSGFKQGILRGPRVQKIGGKDLWESPWIERFNTAAEQPGYQRAQRAIIRSEYFEPALDIVRKYGMTSQADLCVAFDMCVQYGPGGARKRFRKALDELHEREPLIHTLHVLDVIECLRHSGLRAQKRRVEILGHCAAHVHYDELSP